MLSKISVEFGIFFTLITTLNNIGFVKFIILQWLVTIAVIILFASIMAKFCVKIYKDIVLGIKEANKCINNKNKDHSSISGEEEASATSSKSTP